MDLTLERWGNVALVGRNVTLNTTTLLYDIIGINY